MFDITREITIKQEYEDRVRQTAEANLLRKIIRSERNQTSVLTRLRDSLIHVSFHLQRRPHDSLKREMLPKAPPTMAR